MPVAKTYQSWNIECEPYTKNGRQYVKVAQINARLETIRTKEVRWYTEKEYAKMYPTEKPVLITSAGKVAEFGPQKDVLGFQNGYITIFKGEYSEDTNEWFKLSSARYNKYWGWYFISTDTVPDDVPEVEAIRLNWELVGNEDGYLKTEKEIKEAIETLMYEPDNSEFVGSVGSMLELTLTVEKAIPLDGYYGRSIMHIMRDDEQNCFVWTTTAKSWDIGTVHRVRGSVKDQRIYKGTKQTILTRCREI